MSEGPQVFRLKFQSCPYRGHPTALELALHNGQVDVVKMIINK